jgi:bifunctional DNase/RNase
MADSIKITRQTRKTFTIEYPTGTDFSGKTPKIEIRKIPSDTILFTLTNGSGISISSNIITCTITTAQSELMVDDKYRADLAFTQGGEVVYRTPTFYLTAGNKVTNAL